jgi:hypothetical protein
MLSNSGNSIETKIYMYKQTNTGIIISLAKILIRLRCKECQVRSLWKCFSNVGLYTG